MMAEEQTPPIDSNTTNGAPPQVQGTMVFTCCGKQHTANGTFRNVTCPWCKTTYEVYLVALLPVDSKYPPGARVRVTKETVVKVGSKEIKYAVGEELTVGADPHGILGTLENETLVECQSKAFNGKMRILLAPLPNDVLEEIPTTPQP